MHSCTIAVKEEVKNGQDSIDEGSRDINNQKVHNLEESALKSTSDEGSCMQLSCYVKLEASTKEYKRF